jgi:hypothetical protein
MSKAMVAVNAGSQNEVVSVKSGRKEIVSQDRLTSWLEEARSGKSLLSPVIPSTVNGSQLELNAQGMNTGTISVYAIMLGAQGAAVGGIGSWIINAALASSSSSFVLPAWFDLSTVAAGAGLLGVGSVLLTRFFNKKGTLLWNTVLQIQSEGLRSWLQARYQVEVSDEVLAVTAANMLQSKKNINLSDTSSRNWVLRFNGDKQSYQLDPQQVAVKSVEQEALLQQAPVKIAVGTASLPDSAQNIVDSIDTRLTQLHKFALSTEQSHVVARTVEDAREAVAAFERLDALGAGESGLERLTSILRLLDGELEEIVQARIAEESTVFASRQRKIEARHSKVEI